MYLDHIWVVTIVIWAFENVAGIARWWRPTEIFLIIDNLDTGCSP
jgi:hypothetical protein